MSNLNNWVKEENVAGWKRSAARQVEIRNAWEKTKKQKTVPHPTAARCVILKYNENGIKEIKRIV